MAIAGQHAVIDVVTSAILRHEPGMQSRCAFGIVAILGLSACSEVYDLGPPSGFTVPSQDVVVVGRLENLESETSQFGPDDLLGYGWFHAKLHVAHVETGKLPNKVISVRYFGHTWFREDKRFRFHLRPNESGGYFICSRSEAAGFNCAR